MGAPDAMLMTPERLLPRTRLPRPPARQDDRRRGREELRTAARRRSKLSRRCRSTRTYQRLPLEVTLGCELEDAGPEGRHPPTWNRVTRHQSSPQRTVSSGPPANTLAGGAGSEGATRKPGEGFYSEGDGRSDREECTGGFCHRRRRPRWPFSALPAAGSPRPRHGRR